jgi:peptidoglycan hydrolase-like protein with peptidoglycan-binding domain
MKPQVAPAMPMEAGKSEMFPPQGPYKPTTEEIQKALQQAGFYTSTIDGKMGPGTKKAIQEFQKANGLQADGKVGPKTWAVLGKYSNVSGEAPKSKKNKKR